MNKDTAGYLLDTSSLSEFLKKAPNDSVIRWFTDTDEQQHFVSTLTIGEIQKGISRLGHSRRRTELKRWLAQVIDRYLDRLLPIGLTTARVWGDLLADLEGRGRRLPVIDSLLAATAVEHNLTIVTRNEEDFTPAGVKILNLWR